MALLVEYILHAEYEVFISRFKSFWEDVYSWSTLDYDKLNYYYFTLYEM